MFFNRMLRGGLVSLMMWSAPALAGVDHAVVLLYHHVSGETPAATSITPQRFGAHLEYLDRHDFRVWPLARLLERLRGGEPVPDNVVAITFDDAYESVFTEARPRLSEYGWPYTVFVNTDAVDAGHAPYMNWDQLRTLARNGAAIGNHSASHAHLVRRRNDEGEGEWRERVGSDIARARARIREEIGVEPELFAWPYGEDSASAAEIVSTFHEFALAQRSGAVGRGEDWNSDWLSLPRFPMATGFDSIDRFATAVNARPLPVIGTMTEPPLGDGVVGNPRRLVLKLGSGGYRTDRLNCFAASGRRLELESGKERRQVRARLEGIGRPGRNKVNCTAPAADDSGDYYWYSFQWLQRRPDGGWPAE